ncbi:MAG: substrate-binding domain-containing protein [Sulfolobales archaeon]
MSRGLSQSSLIIYVISLIIVAVVSGAIGYYVSKSGPTQGFIGPTSTYTLVQTHTRTYTEVSTVHYTKTTSSVFTVYTNYPSPPSTEVRIVISTTTSLYATGLLDYLASEFNKIYPNIKINFVAVGTGAALKIAEKGDACAVFVHAPNLEQEYINKGVIEYGRIIAYNFFIIVGPPDDPAKVKDAPNVVEAFKRIYEAGEKGQAIFISRGDNSGTHVKELSIWNKTGLNPRGRPWYKEAGAGMDQVLVMTNELRAYTLSDIGTYLKFKKEGRLPNVEELFAKGSDLINIYSTYLVKSCPDNIKIYAKAFLDFVYNNQKQLIGTFGVAEYGAPLFNPAIDKEKELACTWLEIAKGG